MNRRSILLVGCLATILTFIQTGSTIKAKTSQALIQSRDFCGTEHDPVEIAAHERAFAKRKLKAPAPNARPGESVNVHFHVITDGIQGNIDDNTIDIQMQVLNRSFRQRGVTFELSSVERITNPTWFTGCQTRGIERQMKSELHQGTAVDLNVYICEPARNVGWATFPWWYAHNPSGDGVVLYFGVLPGGIFTSANTGEVLVHETGHWMGLYHTFQGGCGGDGDYVADTPDEAEPNLLSCPVGLDTCPSPGLDPIESYMDYSGDACWTEFTQGQYTRMDEKYAIYRSGQ